MVLHRAWRVIGVLTNKIAPNPIMWPGPLARAASTETVKPRYAHRGLKPPLPGVPYDVFLVLFTTMIRSVAQQPVVLAS